jgi:hypothetical protein
MKRTSAPLLTALAVTFATVTFARAQQPTIGTVRTMPVISASLAVGSTGKETKRLTYTPPPGWYIRSHRVVVERKHGIVSYSTSTVPAGWHAKSSERSASASRSTAAAILATYKAWAGGRAEEAQDKSASGRYANSASHHALLVEVTAEGEGLFMGGASVELTVYAEMVYVGRPAVRVASTK